MPNMDRDTVDSFGDEWSRFRQDQLDRQELETLFQNYFAIFPWNSLPPDATGFDMGCGSGRWARLVAPRVGHLTCIDPSPDALSVAADALAEQSNVTFVSAGVSGSGLKPSSQDFGYSLGVLHHIPDTLGGLNSCTALLRPGAPFLLYLYYRFDNRPAWFRVVWWLSNLIRKLIVKLPPSLKGLTTDFLAVLLYFPIARSAAVAEYLGLRIDHWPLSSYRHTSFYTMRTDSRDRFGTPMEHRFTRDEIQMMMESAGLERIRFSESVPFWCAVGFRK